MSIWTNFLRYFGGGTQTRNKGAQSGEPSNAATSLGPVAPEKAMQLSAVWACTRLITECIAALPVRFYKVNDKGIRTLDPNNKLGRLLAGKPNRYQTRVEFFETLTMQLALHGNAYCAIARAGKEIVSLLPLMSEQVEVSIAETGALLYKYTTSTGVSVFAEESIWHVKLMGNGVIGLSPLGHAWNTLGIALANEDRVANLAKRGFKPAGVLMVDKLLKAEQREQIRKQFADLQTGDGDPLKVLEAGMTYQQVSMSPKDVQLLESRRFQVEDICRFFGVPSVLINHTGSTTTLGAGIGEIIQGFYKFTLRPYLERYEASIKIRLMDGSERNGVEVEFDFNALLRGDEKSRMETHKAAIQGGVNTPDERRAMEGWSPLPGGDRLYLQAQMVPAEMLPIASGGAAPKSETEEKEQVL